MSLETDAEVRDKYGRLLAYVYVGGVRYDDELLRLGFARLLIIPPNGVHAARCCKPSSTPAPRAAGCGARAMVSAVSSSPLSRRAVG